VGRAVAGRRLERWRALGGSAKIASVVILIHPVQRKADAPAYTASRGPEPSPEHTSAAQAFVARGPETK
jgi:hypothetical protein